MSGRVSTFFAVLLGLSVTVALAACAGPPPGSSPDSGVGGTGAHVHPSEPPSQPLRDGERFVDLALPQPYTPRPPRGGTDEYRCFLLDPAITEPVFVTGSQFLPQNEAIVHHAIVFRVDPEDADAAQAAAGPAGWTCFGGAGFGRGVAGLGGGGSWIAAWAPGTGESLLTEGTGYELDPGSLLILQIHYSLLGVDGEPGPDQSGIRLRVVDGTADVAPLRTALLPAPVELPCTPEESGELCDRDAAIRDVARRFGTASGLAPHALSMFCTGSEQPKPGPTQSCEIPVRRAGTVYAVAGHMHLLGRSITVELNPGTDRAQILLDIPVYNFDDQRARELPEPVEVRPGDMYRVTCTHDASLRARLPLLQDLPPRYVVWGDGTSDEMCLGIVVWSPAEPR
ncbi:MAG TPA: monooxygenase [Micromonosporaceae bacterium]|nr:monooxygenase [Micromonosporaceae bacterium]